MRRQFGVLATLFGAAFGFYGCVLDSSGDLFGSSSGGSGGESQSNSTSGSGGNSTSSTTSISTSSTTSTTTSSATSSSSTTSSSTSTGSGGSGPLSCASNTDDTPQSVTAQGAASTSAYVHSYAEADQYSAATPATLTLSGTTNPTQVVLSGFNGLSLIFGYSGASPSGEDFYSVNASQVPECSGTNYMSQSCETKVAQDFRCIYYPGEESNCSSVKASFTSLGQLTYYSTQMGGYSKVLASIRCKP